MKQYLIRLDDACPTMDNEKWGAMEQILDRHGIKPMVGVIPHNEDSKQLINPEDKDFWIKVKRWSEKGWAIALHGYNHCYSSQGGLKGLNPMWSRSEFAGLPLTEQIEKIKAGVSIMRKHGINPMYFFAPSHTFDENTLRALREESDIRIISDTIATRPYTIDDFIVIPQFSGQCREIKLQGLFTFCLHPNIMKESAMKKTELFIQEHKRDFTSFDSLNLDMIGNKCLFDKVLEKGYFLMRRIKGIK